MPVKKGTEKEPKIEAWRVPNGTFETHYWPVIKDMLFMPFCLVLFLDRKPCFFACAFFVKTIRFSEVFFLPKILGREGGRGEGGKKVA